MNRKLKNAQEFLLMEEPTGVLDEASLFMGASIAESDYFDDADEAEAWGWVQVFFPENWYAT